MSEDPKELESRKRREMEEAIESGAVAEPFSMTALLVSLAVSAATTAASYLITRAFAPKPQPLERGKFVGDLLMSSEMGVMIPEIYGGAPGDNLGGLPVGGTIIWTSGIRKHTTVTRQPTGGGKMGGGGGSTQEVREITYDLDIATMWCRGPALVRKEWANADEIYQYVAPAGEGSGVFDPLIPIDDPYDPELPPDPALDYDRPIDRHRGNLVVGGQNQRTGTLLQGAYSSVAIYPGNTTQLVDSTIQAAVDALYGANSTPAYRNRCYTRHANFSLSRWGGVMPNLRAVVEHETLKTLDVICAHWCTRVGILAADYSFTNLSAVTSRGIMISGRRYQPSEVMDGLLKDFYNVIFCEPEGVITGYVRGTTPSVTIDDSEIGWLDTDEIPDGPMPEIDTSEPDATKLPRRVDVKFIDPEKDWQPNTQGESRQITDGEESQVLEVQVCAKASEARQVAARKLYQAYVERPHRFTLSWQYLYLYPGYQIITTRDEGFTYRMELTSIRGGIGVLECEAVDLEPATYAPPVTGAGGQGFEVPPLPVPAMTICALMDVPLLRDKDETINNGSVFYACGTPRTNDTDQVYQGFSLYVNKVGWERIADFTLPATMGRLRSFTALTTITDTSVFDNTSTVTVDLYGTTQILASASEEDVYNGQNAALLGDEVIQFRTATRDGAGPNRWILSGLLRARRATDLETATHVVNERFILLNEAVQPVPINLQDLDQEREYKAVTVGQSLDDAATVDFVWTGKSLQGPTAANFRSDEDSSGNRLIEFEHRVRFGGGLRDFRQPIIGEEQLKFQLRLYTTNWAAPLPNERVMDIIPGMTLAAALVSSGAITSTGKSFTGVTDNTLTSTTVLAASLQTITQTGNHVEAGLEYNTSFGGYAELSIVSAQRDWRGMELLADRLFTVRLQGAGDPVVGTLYIYRAGTLVYTHPTAVSSGARIKIVFSGTEIRFHLNGGDEPVHRDDFLGSNFPVRVLADTALSGGLGGGTVRKILIKSSPHLKTIYAASQRVIDYGSSSAVAYGKLYQISALVGKGQELLVTF